MRTYKYTGLFISAEGHKYELDVNCNGYIQAFFLLIADAIRSGQHYQLTRITHEDGSKMMVENILKVGSLLTEA